MSTSSKRRLPSPITTGKDHQPELLTQIQIEQAPRKLPAALHGHVLVVVVAAIGFCSSVISRKRPG